MKIDSIHATRDYGEGGATEVSLTISFGALDPTTAVQQVLNIFSATPAITAPEVQASLPLSSSEAPTPASTSTEAGSPSRRTRTRTTPSAADNAPPATAETPAAELAADTSSRRRRPAEAAAVAHPAEATITDADLSKAASIAADELVKLGDDGPGIILAVLADFDVTDCSKVPADQREKLLTEFRKEVALAEEAHKTTA